MKIFKLLATENILLEMKLPKINEIGTEFSELTISFEDIENSVKSFDNSVFNLIHKWLDEFKSISKLFNLSDLHKLIFANRLIKDSSPC